MWNDKFDGYLIPSQNLMGTGMDMNFYPRVQVQIFSYRLFTNRQVITLLNVNPTY
jgi:hypothetical protein